MGLVTWLVRFPHVQCPPSQNHGRWSASGGCLGSQWHLGDPGTAALWMARWKRGAPWKWSGKSGPKIREWREHGYIEKLLKLNTNENIDFLPAFCLPSHECLDQVSFRWPNFPYFFTAESPNFVDDWSPFNSWRFLVKDAFRSTPNMVVSCRGTPSHHPF